MKKLAIVAIIASTFLLAGCGSSAQEDKTSGSNAPTSQTQENTKKEDATKANKFKLNPEQFMTDNQIELKALDVEFDMGNNVDKSFLIAGTASLDDYYNYNYRDDIGSKFVVRVTPNSVNAGDSWYVYFDREEFKDLFDALKQGKQEILVKAINPSSKNVEGMGNLATGEAVSFDKEGSSTKVTKLSKGLTEFTATNQIELQGKDVEFDMKNNIDKSFALEGNAKLSDYYNFNFNGKEKEYFNVKLDTTDNLAGHWNLYFSREDFKDLFEQLKTGNKNILVKAIIPSNIYEDGMGNMAVGEVVQVQ